MSTGVICKPGDYPVVVTIQLSASGVEKTILENIKKEIEAKAAALHINANVTM